jgi:hypothetical protein
MDFHAKEIKMKQVGIYFLMENISLLSMALVLGGGFLLQGSYINISNELILTSIVIGMFLIILTPIIVNYLSVENANEDNIISVTKTLCSLVITGIVWILAGTSFWFYITGYQMHSEDYSFFELAGTYIYSWAIGFIAIFSPQGLGVTEFVASSILSFDEEIDVYLILIFGFRLVIICADMLMWMLVKSICRKRKT